jgi:hypothetical protein
LLFPIAQWSPVQLFFFIFIFSARLDVLGEKRKKFKALWGGRLKPVPILLPLTGARTDQQ